MKNLVFYKIDHAYSLPYRTVINKDIMTYYEKYNDIISSSKIYFICRQKKVRFCVDSIKVKNNILLFRLFMNGKRTKKIRIGFPDYISINKETLSDTNISIKINNQRIHYSPEAVINGLGLDNGHRPEVLYIGMTFNKNKRFKNHIQLLKATTMINEDEDIIVYFIKYRVGICCTNPFNLNPYNLWTDLKDRESEEIVNLCERLFICIFKPPLNSLHVASKLSSDKRIKKILVENNIHYAHIDIGMNNSYFQFLTPSTDKGNDWYNYNFDTDSITTGMPTIWE